MRKRNKLYTANQWNQPLFQDNIFEDGGGLDLSAATSGIDVTGGGITGLGNPAGINLGKISSMKTPNLGIGKALGNLAKGAAGAVGGIVGAGATKLLSGGLNSGAGNAISKVGGTVGSAISSVNPLLGGIVSVGSGILGGGVNALFGTKTDQKKLNAANQGTAELSNFKSNATSFDDIQGPNAVASVQNAYKGGLFKKGWAKKKNNALRTERATAESWANRSVDNNIDNIASTQMDNMLANYAAFGGSLGSQGAIDYNFMSDYLTTKNKVTEGKNKVGGGNIFGSLQATPFSSFALGGDMQTNGGDYSTGLTHIDAGNSHEENPYDGVQLGISSENGQPNLVEEGETVFDDYVFSRRIKPDARTKKKFHVGKNSGMSFADLSKKLEKESEERPNDAISQAALTKQMHSLAEEQERQKQETQAKEAQDAFMQLPPEQQRAIMQQLAMEEQQAQAQQQEAQEQQLSAEQQQQLAQQQPDSQQIVDENMQQQQPQMEETQMAACGGKLNKFDKGGDMKTKMFNLLGLHTDSDLDKWLTDNNIDADDIDWENILKNQKFVDVITSENPALRDALSKGYDFGTYVPNTSSNLTFDFKHGGWGLEDYDAWDGSTDAAWQEAVKKGLVKKGMNSEEIGKALSQTDAYKKGSDWLKADEGNRLTYLQSILNNEDAPQAARNYAAKYVDKNGWLKDVKRDYQTIFEDPNGTGVRNTHPGTYWKTPNEILRDKVSGNYVVNDDGTIEEIIGDVPKDWTRASNYNWQDDKSDYTYNYYKRPSASSDGTTVDDGSGNGDGTKVPKHRNETLRYAGLLGPVVGLGMQALGIGKPDYSKLDASVEAASGAPALAHYKPIGNYLPYKPMDIWFEQNRQNANARATDRAIMNNASPLGTKMAGLLANGYNNQIASGNLYRQALEYNDAQRQKVEEFNRGTDMYNADAFTKTSATNAQLINSNRQFKAQMMMDAAKQRMTADAAWNQGIYGNVSGLFKGISDLGKENAQHNMIADMAADGIFGTMNNQYIGRNYLKNAQTTKRAAKGGRINRKRGLTI